MSSIAFIQPYDRPWTDSEHVARGRDLYISRTPFEVGYQVPEHPYGFYYLDLNLELRLGKTIEEAVRVFISRHEPEIVMLTMPVYVLGDQLDRIVKTVKQMIPNSKIILGGGEIALVQNLPLHLWPDIECCYDGYGFEIPRLLEACIADKRPTIPGVYWKEGIDLPTRGERRLVDDYSARDFYTMKGRFDFPHYISRIREAGLVPMGTIEMTRGCSFRCSFCALNGERQGLHHRSPKVVASEARFLVSHGAEYIHLVDPTFGLDRNRQDELLIEFENLRKDFPNLKFELLTRPELVTEEFAKAMRAAGVVRCAIGMETMDGVELSSVGKTLKPTRTEQAVRHLAGCGVETKLFHIVFPGRLSESTIAFFLKLTSEGLPFVVQSSFLRTLSSPKSSHEFVFQDQTVYNLGHDTEEQLMEWMLANLAFPSVEIEGGGDPKLRQRIASYLARGRSLKKLFVTRHAGQTVEIQRAWFEKFTYTHRPGLDVAHNLTH